ncbi:hypothetical protein XALC_1242 [Xanthomonas albilineans GPE PC73]|uniref:Uncharacterized protein n=1 Tax=Xanthomonas albilineans (strain GPE PC73 / CFBP 7063) TaxID=380358 RepID=D2UA22_XANAP|nr:hypothetical protein XALC_1242 [Xanthomonas albilineans GPE PC73]
MIVAKNAPYTLFLHCAAYEYSLNLKLHDRCCAACKTPWPAVWSGSSMKGDCHGSFKLVRITAACCGRRCFVVGGGISVGRMLGFA